MPATYPDNITTEHPFFTANKADWELIYAAYHGGAEFISTDYIVKHPHETAAAHKARVSRALYFNFMRQALTKLVRLIMVEGVIRTGVADMSQFLVDANGYRTTFDAFMRDAGVVSAMYGNAHILTDYAISAEENDIVSLSDIMDGAVFPTVELLTPLQMINWRKRRRRGYEWCIFLVKRIVEDKETDVYIKVDYENIEEVDAQGNVVSPSFAHGLGFCPVFDLPYADVHRRDMQRGLGTDLAYVAKGILNVVSLAEEVADRHAFTQLTMPDDGSIEELQAKQSDYLDVEATPEYYDFLSTGQDPTLAKLARSTVMTFPANTGHPPAFITPDSQQLSSIWDMAKDSIDLALYAVGMTDKAGKTDVEGTGAILSELSKNMQEVEKLVLYTVGMYMGTKPTAGAIEVLYPTSFSVLPFTDWLKNFTSVAGMSTVSDEFKLGLLKNMILSMPGNMSQTEKMGYSNSLTLVAPPEVVPPGGATKKLAAGG